MKRKNKSSKNIILGTIGISMLVIIFGYFFVCRTKITTSEAELIYGSKSYILSQEESDVLKEIFNNKLLYFDSPSCGFGEDIAIKFGELIFCIACDNCGTIRYGDMYFSISDKDREVINQIFINNHGRRPSV